MFDRPCKRQALNSLVAGMQSVALIVDQRKGGLRREPGEIHQEINKNLTGLIAVWYLIPVLEYILQSLTVL